MVDSVKLQHFPFLFAFSALLSAVIAAAADQAPLPTGPHPYYLTVADLNRDGFSDAIIPCRGMLYPPDQPTPANDTITVYYTAGNAALATRQDYKVGFGPYTAAAGDLDGDGRNDVVVVNFQANDGRHLSILYGQPLDEALMPAVHLQLEGDAFQNDKNRDAEGNPVYASPGLTSLALADVNTDGRLDIVAVAWTGDFFCVLLNEGGRRFQQRSFPLLPGPRDVAAGDFDGDGHLDLAFTVYSCNLVAVWHGRGDGDFTPAQTFLSQGATPYHLKAGDLDGDGLLDLVVGNRGGTDNVAVFHNSKAGFVYSGFFSGPVGSDNPAGDEIRDVLLHDADGDGVLDLFAACHLGDRVLSWRGTGRKSYGAAFSNVSERIYPGKGPRSLAFLGNELGIVFFTTGELAVEPALQDNPQTSPPVSR